LHRQRGLLRLSWLWSIAWLLAGANIGIAQSERFELGRRLRHFEAAWEKYDTDSTRQRAQSRLRPLTNLFFSGRLAEAARTLDRATFALQSAREPSAGQQWAAALKITPHTRLLDAKVTELSVTIAPLYQPEVPLPANSRLRLWFTNTQVVEVSVRDWPLTVAVPLPALGERTACDRRLYVLLDTAGNLQPATLMISQVKHLHPRLERLSAALEHLPPAVSLEAATIRHRLAAFRQALRGEIPITDFPYAQWLENAEVMANGRPFFTPQRQGQYWLTIPVAAEAAVPCRLYVPKGLRPEAPVPLVVALHGAGVDENMFFESYGAGHIVRECQQRRWLLLAPRASFFGPPPLPELIDALAQRYPIDRRRIFLVGHSMGAAHAASWITRRPHDYAAWAALGAAPPFNTFQRRPLPPVFLAVGTEDTLAYRAARTLNQRLLQAKVDGYRYREYTGLEHLLIVRQALPDVFAFFDDCCQRLPPQP
jgi:predicted esterase